MRYLRALSIILAVLLFLLAPTTVGLVTSGGGKAHAAYVGKGFGTDNDQAALNNAVSAAPISNNFFYYQTMSVSCSIFPFRGPDNCTDNDQLFFELYNKSAVGNIASAMGAMYANPPANLALWIRETQTALGFAKPVYAQGLGSPGLAPLLPVWRAIRNIAYFLLALAMIVVGFMVMMRQKIDPKTVVTVQNSIPRIVIALILITFSYPIAGFLIDIMYLVIGILVSVITTQLPIRDTAGNRFINYNNPGFFDFFVSIWAPILNIYSAESGGSNLLGEYVKTMVGFGAFTFKSFFLGPFFLFLVAIGYLFAFIRILFMLIGAYIQILMAVITGPIQILTDVFPGANGFSNWIKNLLSSLSVFPITILMLLIANVIGQRFGDQPLWTPPLLPQGSLGPYSLGGIAELLITIGIFFAIPSVVNTVKEALKAQGLMPSGLDVVSGQIKSAFPLAMQVGSMWFQHQQMAKFGELAGKGDGAHKPK